MNIKELKKEAKRNIKNNYFKSLLVVVFTTFVISGGVNLSSRNILNKTDITSSEQIEVVNTYNRKSNSEVLDEILEKTEQEKETESKISNKYYKGLTSTIVNETAKSRSITFGILNSINNFLGGNISIAYIIIISNIILFLLRGFFLSALEVGRNRYFLEQRRYLNTNIDSALYPYKKKRPIHISAILMLKDLKLFLWSLTIIGGVIKTYKYAMIPFLLAENPNMKSKELFKTSKELMKGNKFKLFKIDLSLLLYELLGAFTFSLLNIFFTNIYKETLYAEFYVTLRNNKYKELTYKDLLNDKLLYIDEKVDKEYPQEKKEKKSLLNLDYNQKYTIISYILFFFTFSFVGWIYEVMIHIVRDGEFVNRGTMYGPWLPIYGFGGIAILFFLKRFRHNHFHLFLASFILCGVLEYIGAYLLETTKHLKYWDYTGYFLNIHGRICLEGLIIFGLGGCGFTYIAGPLLENIYKKYSQHIKKIIVTILLLIFSIDLIISSFIKPNTGEGITTPATKGPIQYVNNYIFINR